MSKKAIAVAAVLAISGTIGYLLLRSSKKKVSQEDGLLKPTNKDAEIYHKKLKPLTANLSKREEDLFYHNYVTIKHYLKSSEDFNHNHNLFLACLFYAADVKGNPNHDHRNILGVTAKMIEEDLISMVSEPSNEFIQSAKGIRECIVANEGMDIYPSAVSA